MKRLAYISTAKPALKATDLEAILEAAVAFNSSRNINGLLLFNGLNFFQVLEGAPDEVRDLYAKITEDKRHHGVVTILEEPIDETVFPGWAMRLKYRPCDAGEDSRLEVTTDDLKEDLPEQIPPSLKMLLQSFNTIKA